MRGDKNTKQTQYMICESMIHTTDISQVYDSNPCLNYIVEKIKLILPVIIIIGLMRDLQSVRPMWLQLRCFLPFLLELRISSSFSVINPSIVKLKS